MVSLTRVESIIRTHSMNRIFTGRLWFGKQSRHHRRLIRPVTSRLARASIESIASDITDDRLESRSQLSLAARASVQQSERWPVEARERGSERWLAARADLYTTG